MTKFPDLAIPSIHLNGTSQDALLEQYSNAMAAVQNAIEVLNQSAPHPRDYYPQKPTDAFFKARSQHLARLAGLESIHRELQDIALAVSDGGYKQEPKQ